MPIKSFRLNSVVPHGVGSNSETSAIEFIYAALLKKFGADAYGFSVVQIGSDLNEIILKETPNRVHINIRYPVDTNFENKTVQEKNLIRLEVIHAALLRFAEKDSKLDIKKLNLIKEDIIKNDFNYEFQLKQFTNRKNKDLVAKIILNPQIDKFVYHVSIENKGLEFLRLPLYNGLPGNEYFTKFFQKGRWKNEYEIIITGKDNIVETHILIDEKRIDFINLTDYENPPMFQLMKAGISKDEKEKTLNDWYDSLPLEMSKFLKNYTYEV
jgi:ribosomal protein L31E